MIQDTSLEAWYSIQDKLGRAQKQVLDVLKIRMTATNNEIAESLGWSISSVTPRICELRKIGLVEDAGKRNDRVTGRTAHAWRYVPIPPAKKEEPPQQEKGLFD